MALVDKSKLLKASDFKCPRCGAPLKLSRGRNGNTFWRCSAYETSGCSYHEADRNRATYIEAKKRKLAEEATVKNEEDQNKDSE